MKKSLFKEFMQASEYINYNDIYAKAEIPIKEQLQQLLANLPDEEQMMAFEGDIKTLKISIDAMKFESPSMASSIEYLSNDVLVIREKLRNVFSRVQQLLRDMNLESPHKGEKKSNDKWDGISHGKDPNDFDKDDLKKGARVEMEHTKNPKIAIRIAMDHLSEDPLYYDKLEKIENNKRKEI